MTTLALQNERYRQADLAQTKKRQRIALAGAAVITIAIIAATADLVKWNNLNQIAHYKVTQCERLSNGTSTWYECPIN